MTYGGQDENATQGLGQLGGAGHRRPLSNIDNVLGANANGRDGAKNAKATSKAKAAALGEKNMVNSAVPRQLRPRDPNTGAVVSSSIVEAAKTRSTVSRTSRPSGTSMSSVLQARSESVRPKRRSQSATAITAPKSPMPDIDSQDKDNYLCETGYVQDIYSYFRAVENRFCVCPYMDRQPDINDKMRAILIDWLVEVHLKFRLMPETLFLTVQIIDRYLAIDCVTRKNLQLVGVTAMLIASKYEEIWAPEVRDFVFICDSAYTREEILAMEKLMLNKLQFKITAPTAYHFLARFIKACGPTEKRFNMLCMYAVEISFPEYDLLNCSYSKVAAAAVLLARQVMNAGPWTHALEKHTGYAEADIQSCADKMLELMKKASSTNVSLKAVHKKYSNARFHSVTTLVPST